MKTKLSPWMREPVEPGETPFCWMRILEGGDPNEVRDRVAFCEKSGRVRVAPYSGWPMDSQNWESVSRCGYNSKSNLLQCDLRLIELGYDLDNVIPDEAGLDYE